MFSLCLYITKAERRKDTKNTLPFTKNIATIGVATIAAIDDNDEIREIKNTASHTKPANINRPGASAAYTAKVVATPLPPLYSSHTGNTWPSTAASAAN